ncbi:hypothetical protein B0T20DRAFT_463458 [Sordaria brevicollis]|uniref:Uncharacterized protein n=1 Tax=Sordaria brevicollis TaxID=83679 RepID=A0AAE0P9L8_SORBR|nr:hypothetical protein B0T20DRAFT_463458 [Sordaria brevicollis]
MTPQTSHCCRLLQLSRTPRIPSIPRSPLPTGPPCLIASAAEFPHLASWVQTTRRTVGSVPGPLEARRRLGKRNLGDLNALQCPPTPPPWAFPYPVDLSQWKWEPPSSASAQHVAFDRMGIAPDNPATVDLCDDDYNADFFVDGWTAHQRESKSEPIAPKLTPQYLEQLALEEGIQEYEDTQHSTQEEIPFEGWPSQDVVQVVNSRNHSHSTTASDIFGETGDFTWDPKSRDTNTLYHSNFQVIEPERSPEDRLERTEDTQHSTQQEMPDWMAEDEPEWSPEDELDGPEGIQHSAQQNISREEGSIPGGVDIPWTVDPGTANSANTDRPKSGSDLFDDSGFFSAVPETKIDRKTQKSKDNWISKEAFMEQWTNLEPPDEAELTKPKSAKRSKVQMPAWFKDPEKLNKRSIRRGGDTKTFSEAIGQTMPDELENLERDIELETADPEVVTEQDLEEEEVLEEVSETPSSQYQSLRQDVERLQAAYTEPLAIFAEMFSGICENLKQHIIHGGLSTVELRAISHELIRTIQERWGEDEEFMQTHYTALYNMTQAQLAVFLKAIIDGVRASETLTPDVVEPAFWRQFFEWMAKLEVSNQLYYLFYWGMRTVSQPGIKKGMEGILAVLERILVRWATQPPGTTDLGEGAAGGQLPPAIKKGSHVDDPDETNFDNNDLEEVVFHENEAREEVYDPNQELYLDWPPPDPNSISCVDSVLFALNVRTKDGDAPQRNSLHVRWVSAALEALSPHKHSILFDAATELVLQLGSTKEGLGSPVVYNWLSVLAQMDGVNTKLLCEALDAFKTVPQSIEHLGNFHMCSLMLFHWASRDRLKRRYLTARVYRRKHEKYQVGLDNSQLAALAFAIFESEPATNQPLLFTSMFHILRSFNRVHHLPRALKKFASRGFINRTLLEDLAYLCNDHKVALKMRRIWEAFAWKKKDIPPHFRERIQKRMDSSLPPKMDDGDKTAPFSTHVYLKYAKQIIADPTIKIGTIWKVLDIPKFEEAFDPDTVTTDEQKQRLAMHGNIGDKRAAVVAQIAPLFASVDHLSDRQKYRLMQQSIAYLEEVEAIKAARGMGNLTEYDIQSTVKHTLSASSSSSSSTRHNPTRDALHQPNPWNQGLSADVLMALYKVVTKDLVMGRPGRETRLKYFIQCMERHYGPEVARATRQKLVDWRRKLYERDKPDSYQVRRRRELGVLMKYRTYKGGDGGGAWYGMAWRVVLKGLLEA